jgi:Phytanoyl-CoA dioxygenase (PhyH)
MSPLNHRSLTRDQVALFIQDGFIRLESAFPGTVAEEARAILWRDLSGCDPRDPTTWVRPVVRLGMYSQQPFLEAANTPLLHSAFDRLVGGGRWLPCMSVGTFPVRFPSSAEAEDTGWHIDPGFDFHQPDFMDWRANVFSKGRALLMLFLFSDVGGNDAPTRLRVGSHRDVARMLAPAAERGMTLGELARNGFAESRHRPEVHAVGAAGTVYLCHPLLVHAAQQHRGSEPRFVAQPPLLLRPEQSFQIAGEGLCAVEQAIHDALRSDEDWAQDLDAQPGAHAACAQLRLCERRRD